jgi:hypothetical protein
MGMRYAEYVTGVVEIRQSYKMLPTDLKGRQQMKKIIAGSVKIIH